MELIKRGFNYLQINGTLKTLLAIFRLLKSRFYIVRINSATKAALQRVLSKLKFEVTAEDVFFALIRKIGPEHTRILLNRAQTLDNYFAMQTNLKFKEIVHASSLPTISNSSKRLKILFITAEFPSPHHGGGNRVLNFIKALSVTNDIYLCTAFTREEHEHSLSLLDKHCIKILKLPFDNFEKKQSQIHKWLGDTQIDIVHYEWPRSLENYDSSLGKFQIFTYMEAVGLRLLMDMERLQPLSDAWLVKLEQLIAALDTEIVKAAKLDMRIAVTLKDALFFQELCPSQEYTVLNHGLSFAEFTLPDIQPEPNTLTFVGNYLHYPNSEAMDFFFNEVWDDICDAVPDIKIYIVGTNPTQAMIQKADGRKIIVTNTVEDVRLYIQKASICIAPLITGAGLRGKVIEYAALRRTFVATSIATTDLVFRDGIDYLCADTALEFSKKIIRLLKEQNLASKMSASVYEIAKQNYDTEKLTGFLLSAYDYLQK